METLKFLFTSTFYPPYHIGGDAVHVKYLAEELAKLGHEVHVFYSLDAYRLKRKKMVNEEHSCVSTHYVRTSFNASAYSAYALGTSSVVNKKFKKLVEDLNPDIVHHHNISLLGYNILKKHKDYLNIYTAHDYWLVCPKSSLLKYDKAICKKAACLACSLKGRRFPQFWRHGRAFKKAIEEIDLLIAPSNYIKNKLTQEFQIHAATIPNFVPKPPYEIEPSEYSDFFLYAGILEEHKGILSLVTLFKELAVTARLVVVGRGSLFGKIREIVSKYGLEGKIVLLGWVDSASLYSLLKDANALILPSIWAENSPLITLEALSVGTPVLGSDNGGLPEIIGKVDERLLFSNLNKLGEILLNFSRQEVSSQRIKYVYEHYFSSHAYIKKYREAIKSAGVNF